jgi:hypothetical protein
MSVRARGLPRRRLLQGACGTVLGLPLFEYLLNDNGTAYAQGEALPARFLLYYCPTSLVPSSSDPSERFTPTMLGTPFDLPYCLEPLGEAGVAAEVSAVSGLFVAPFDAPGGYDSDYHGGGYRAMLSGLRHGFQGEGWELWGPSVDQVVAETLGAETAFPSLVLQVDPDRAGYGVSFQKRMDGTYWYVEAQTSPARAYSSLFSGFMPAAPGTPDDLEQRLRVSSLSYVKEQLAALSAKLGAADRQRLELHLEQVRALELRIAQLANHPQGELCADPLTPAVDPADVAPSVPDQEARSQLFIDLIQMALACDLTRVVSLSMTDKLTGAGMAHPLWSHIGGLHADVQHESTNEDLDTANRWFVGQYASLLAKLKAVSEGAGTMLDRSVALFCMEGGKGGRAADGGGDQNHSTDNMVMLVGGRAGGLKPGQHIVAPTDAHVATVMNTAMRAVGVSQTLGEIDGYIDALV